MPTDAEDTVRRDVLYPDQSVGFDLELHAEWLDGKLMFWDASDEGDARDLPDGAKFGYWLPVKTQPHGDVWVACPRGLREWLLDNELRGGDAFEIVGLTPGAGENDPYDVEAAIVT